MWTHGVHLLGSTAFDKNLIPPTGTTTYIVCPTGVGQGTPGSPDPSIAVCTGPTVVGPNLDSGLLTEGRITNAVGQINALISPGVNNYNSLYVQLQRRAARGLSLMTSYTFSKGRQSGADFNNQFDLSNTHGPSLLDQRHRLSIAGVYAPDASGISNDTHAGCDSRVNHERKPWPRYTRCAQHSAEMSAYVAMGVAQGSD